MLDSVEIDGEPDGMEEIEVTELDLFFFFFGVLPFVGVFVLGVVEVFFLFSLDEIGYLVSACCARLGVHFPCWSKPAIQINM